MQNIDLNNLSKLSTEELKILELNLKGFEEEPVDIETFIFDRYFLGNYFYGTKFSPHWLDFLNKLYENKLESPAFLIFERGCLTGDTEVYLANGETIKIESLAKYFKNKDKYDFCYNGLEYSLFNNTLSVNENGEVEGDEIIDAFSTGVKPVYRIYTSNNRKVDCTKNHRFLDENGNWVSIDNGLTVGTIFYNSTYFNPILDNTGIIKVEKIEYLGERFVFDITTRKNHNFLLDIGIISHNSIGRGKCHYKDTKIPLLNNIDGKHELTIEEIYNLFIKNKKIIEDNRDNPHFNHEDTDLWIISYNIQDKIYEPDKIADVTDNGIQDLYKIILDNDKYVICTSHHPFLTKDNKWVTIENDLKVGTTSLKPYNWKLYDKDKQSNSEDYQECCHNVKKIEYFGKGQTYDLTTEKNHNFVISAGIVSHNSTTACIGALYDQYMLMCLKSPQEYFGLVPSEQIVLFIMNVTLGLSEQVLMGKINSMISQSPFFSEKLRIAKENRDIKTTFPKNIDIRHGSRVTHTLGTAIHSAVLSEAAFSIYDNQFMEAFNSILARQESRFLLNGKSSGRIWIDSSEKDTGSILNELCDKYRDKEGVVVDSGPLWDIRPWNYGTESENNICRFFYVYKGSDREPASTLNMNDTNQIFRLCNDEPNSILVVPESHRNAFEADIDRALRDLGGVATASKYRLFRNMKMLLEAFKGMPLYEDIIELDFYDTNDQIIDHCKLSQYFDQLPDPSSPRYIHVDIGVSGDKLGFAMSYISGKKDVEIVKDITSVQNNTTVDSAITTITELAFSIKNKAGQQVPLNKVRIFIKWLMDKGVIIGGVSSDSFQSTSMLQEMKLLGIETSVISIDRTVDPYINLRNAIYEGRAILPRNSLLRKELENLLIAPDGSKVDHPDVFPGGTDRGSKDVADATCLSYDTRILLYSGKSRTIEDMYINGWNSDYDYVMSFDTIKSKIVYQKILKIHQNSTPDTLIRIHLEDGLHIDTTDDHLILMSTGEYKRSDSIHIGESLMSLTYKYHDFFTVVDLELISNDKPVYDIQLYTVHNFAVSPGVFVHNCGSVFNCFKNQNKFNIFDVLQSPQMSDFVSEATMLPLQTEIKSNNPSINNILNQWSRIQQISPSHDVDDPYLDYLESLNKLNIFENR